MYSKNFLKKCLTNKKRCAIIPLVIKATTKTVEKSSLQRVDGCCESITSFFNNPSLPSRLADM